MRLSITNAVFRREIGEKESLRLLKECGFDCVDYSFSHISPLHEEEILGEGYLGYAQRLRGFLEELKLPCNQAHGYYPIGKIIKKHSMDDPEYCKTVRSIQAAAVLGAPVVVIHGDANCPLEEYFEHNLKFYRSLEPYAEAAGIRIGVENLIRFDEKRNCCTGNDRLGSPQELAAMVDQLGTKNFTACVDIGHAGISGDPATMIRYLGNERVGALHVHDNDYHYDLHSVPYVESFDWDDIAASLRDIHYSGEFSLEATTFYDAFGRVGLVRESLEFTVAISRYLMKKITDAV